jgi:hypothetical protein
MIFTNNNGWNGLFWVINFIFDFIQSLFSRGLFKILSYEIFNSVEHFGYCCNIYYFNIYIIKSILFTIVNEQNWLKNCLLSPVNIYKI